MNWQLILVIIFVLSVSNFSSKTLACTEMPKINPYEAKVSNVTFEKEVTKKWCLHLNDPNNKSILEFGTVNKSNAQCGVLKFVVYLPDGTKLKAAPAPQPGAATFYKVGTYKMSYTMTSNEPKCRTWDLSVKWGTK